MTYREEMGRRMAREVDKLVMQKIRLRQPLKSVSRERSISRIVLFINVPFDFKRSDIDMIFLNFTVTIDNNKYIIKGVECHCIENIKKDSVIGLLVREI